MTAIYYGVQEIQAIVDAPAGDVYVELPASRLDKNEQLVTFDLESKVTQGWFSNLVTKLSSSMHTQTLVEIG